MKAKPEAKAQSAGTTQNHRVEIHVFAGRAWEALEPSPVHFVNPRWCACAINMT
jgi:hypothetical protein